MDEKCMNIRDELRLGNKQISQLRNEAWGLYENRKYKEAYEIYDYIIENIYTEKELKISEFARTDLKILTDFRNNARYMLKQETEKILLKKDKVSCKIN
jgi:hypothetical protein